MVWIRHASHGQTVIKNSQALGPESPLETDADGYAQVADEAAAELLATLDPNVELASAPAPDDEPGNEDSADDEFDAEAFVDRTPMSDVIDDLESGAYDEHLDAIEAAAERVGVQDAIDARR